MKFLCPTLMDVAEEIDKESFLELMLNKRPEYAIVWDVHGEDIVEFHSRVWVVQYIAVKGKKVFYPPTAKTVYAKRAKSIVKADEIIKVETEEEWKRYLPREKEEKFKPITYWAPDINEGNNKITVDFEDLIQILLSERPVYIVLWDVSLEDVEYLVSRVYVVSYMPVFDDIIHYSYGKFFAYHAMKKFGIPKKEKILLQMPEFMRN